MSTQQDAHFGLANIPFGVGTRKGSTTNQPQSVTRLHDRIYFLSELASKGLLGDLPQEIHDAISRPHLNDLAALGRPAHRQLRKSLQQLLSAPEDKSRILAASASQDEVVMHLPVHVGDFSDFSCSLHHVLNAGEAVMGVRSVPPGFNHFPIGYGGRSSSIVPSGTDIRRPLGQYKSGDTVTFGPSKAMDFELEVAAVVGTASKMGVPIPIQEAEDHIFGFVLLNDWSSRDIQGLEMNPLGPFLGKSSGTTISPWIVTVDALEPFKVPSAAHDKEPAAYLRGSKSQYEVHLQADIVAPGVESTLCKSRLDWLHWTFVDMVAHQTINGCALRTGDLLATGTVSGESDDSHGCLLEITKGGKQTVELKNGDKRTYLQDGDSIRLTAWAGDLGSETGVSFGECFGTLLPAIEYESKA